jgi:hypothetical protein
MVESWVKSLTEGVLKLPNLKIGKITTHPDGYKVKIVGGQLWGEYGFSNFWYWRRVKKNGTLTKKIYNGYGW